MKETKKFNELIEDYYFEMFTKDGEQACRDLMKRVYKKISGGKHILLDDLFEYIKVEVNRICEKYPEIYDTEPQWHIAHLTQVICKEYDYSTQFNRYDMFI